jgi:mannitol-specific phosphotransferase system IIBC component
MTTNKTRLNTDIRKKIGSLILSHFENEKTTERENFISAKEDITTAYNTAFKIASNVVGRAYPKDDVATLQTFKKKYGSACDVVAKDSCFYFANTEMAVENERENNEHFDFKLDASLSGRFGNSDFGIAYFRDDLKSAGLNPEINVQHQEIVATHTTLKNLIRLKSFWDLMARTEYTTNGNLNIL